MAEEAFAGEARELSSSLSIDRPMAEKVIIHRQILKALDDSGGLDGVVFQGGSSIAYCHGGVRLSEDLDFSGLGGAELGDLQDLRECLERRLSDIYDLRAKVALPDSRRLEPGAVNRLRVSVDADPSRPDEPSIHVKAEFANVPAYSSIPSVCRIPGSSGLGGPTIVNSESADELVADKVLSYLATTKYQRIRDLFDIHHLRETHPISDDDVRDMVADKIADYAIGNLAERCLMTAGRDVDEGDLRMLERMLTSSGRRHFKDPTVLATVLRDSISYIRSCAMALGLIGGRGKGNSPHRQNE